MRIQRFISELCILPHRASCSENELKAAKYVWGVLRRINVNAVIDEFKSQKRMTGELITILAGFIVSIIFSFSSPVIGVGLSLISLVLFWGHFSNRFKPVARLFRWSTSWNVVGRMREPLNSHNIILCAHHDTARSGPLWNPERVKSFRMNFLIGAGLLILLSVTQFLKVIFPGASFFSFMLYIFGGYIVLQAMVLFYSGFFSPLVQGASDNATGVAVVLDIAHKLAESPLKNVNVWFVTTGSEEVGAVGMNAFIDQYYDDLIDSKSCFINFDNVGKGQLHYYLGEGMLGLTRFSGELTRLAAEVAGKEKFKQVTPDNFRVAYTDAIVPAICKFPTLLFLATDKDGIIPNWHWPTDTLENVDVEVAELASAFAYELLLKLDRKAKQDQPEEAPRVDSSKTFLDEEDE